MFWTKAANPMPPSQMPQGHVGGFQPMGGQINVSRMTGMGMNSNIAQAANAGMANPNPLTQVTPGKHGLATAGGVQQAAQQANANVPQQPGMPPAGQTQNPPPMMPKMGGFFPRQNLPRARVSWMEPLIPVFKAQVKAAEVATGGASAPQASASPLGSGGQTGSAGVGNPGMGTPAARPGAQNQQGTAAGGGGVGGGTGLLGGNSGPGGQVGAFGVVQPGWSSLRPASAGFGGVTPTGGGVTKQAMMPAGGPTPGLTANQPVPQPGMAPPPPGLPAMPPPNGGAPIPGTMGQPSVDPTSGQPLPPTVNGQPAPPPGGDPAAAGAAPPQGPPPPMDPVTGRPVSSPMQDPPPPTLPSNPRMLPPRPAQQSDHAGMGLMGGLMDDKTQADQPLNAHEATQDIQAEASAMGSKTAGDFRSRLLAELVAALPKSAFEKEAGLARLLGGVFKGAAKAQPTARTASANAPTAVYKPGQAASAVVTPRSGGEGHAAAMRDIDKQWPMLANWLKTGKRVGFSVAPVAAAGAGGKELAAGDFGAMRAARSLFGITRGVGGPAPKVMGRMPQGELTQPMQGVLRDEIMAGNILGGYGRGTGVGAVSAAIPKSISPRAVYRHERAHGMTDQAVQNPELGKGLPLGQRLSARLLRSQSRLVRDVGAMGDEVTAHAAEAPDLLGKVRAVARYFRNSPTYASDLKTHTGRGLLGAAGATVRGVENHGANVAAGGLGLGGGYAMGKSAGDYSFHQEDCPKCGASMEGDGYTGTCNGCQHKWGTKAAYAEMTPFARGFFEHCAALGVDPAAAVEKVGSDYGDEARDELRDGLEKLAWLPSIARGGAQLAERYVPGAVNFGKGLFGLGRQVPMPAAPAAGSGFRGFSQHATQVGQVAGQNAQRAGQMAASPMMRAGNAVNAGARAGWNAVPAGARGQVGMTAGGGALGGFHGQDTPFDTGSTLGNVAVGAAAFNPYLNRMMGQRGVAALGNPLARGAQGGLLGSFGGGMMDTIAGWSGLQDGEGNPTTNFRRMGGALGTVAGGVSGTGRMLRNMAPAGGQLQQAGQRMMAFGEGALTPIRAPFTTIGRAAGVLPAAAPRVGRFATAGNYGRLAGLGTAGVLGVQQGIEGARGVARDFIGREAMPAAQEAATQFADDYIGSRLPAIQEQVQAQLAQMGLLGPDGQFNPMAAVGRGIGGGVDGIFRSLGMDPSRMSPLQKLMVLGGAGVGGIGAAAGSPVMAGVGGVGALAGLLPQLMPGQSQQRLAGQQGTYQPGQPGQAPGVPQGPNTPPPNTPQARNEWLLQQQQQGGA